MSKQAKPKPAQKNVRLRVHFWNDSEPLIIVTTPSRADEIMAAQDAAGSATNDRAAERAQIGLYNLVHGHYPSLEKMPNQSTSNLSHVERA